ncbi:MAG: YbhB/YbcL family Raf kinase inhibitor-like protein [Anaerolineales bacterium]|nr:YbhB/YbcL family Raf kinase inhibitor-like protein [Anaerolineales bacterium]
MNKYQPIGDRDFVIESSSFSEGTEIPEKYTCDGENISPELHWFSPPNDTVSLVLIMDDPDAPLKPWSHWVLYNLSPDMNSLPEAVNPGQLSSNVSPGINSWKDAIYGGPCPPLGTHRYFFSLYALDINIPVGDYTSDKLQELMEGHILAKAVTWGIYSEK